MVCVSRNLGLADLPRPGKANPDVARLECSGTCGAVWQRAENAFLIIPVSCNLLTLSTNSQTLNRQPSKVSLLRQIFPS
jgi:hypothetical protein